MSETDRKILELIANDESFDRGFALLVQTYQEKMYWNIRRLVHLHEDADDVLQNTFVKVFRFIKGFKGESQLYTWLYRIAGNEAINHINRQRKSQGQHLEDQLHMLAESLKADIYFDGGAAQLCLAKAISTLPDKQKQVFVLRYYDELSYSDISEILQTSVGALKASYHHAVRKVEHYLKNTISYVRG